MKPVKMASTLNTLISDHSEAVAKKRNIADSVKAVLNHGADPGNADLSLGQSFKGQRSQSSMGGGRIRSAVANLL